MVDAGAAARGLLRLVMLLRHFGPPGCLKAYLRVDQFMGGSLTRYKGQLKLKDWAFAIARRSTVRKTRTALARRLAIIITPCCSCGTKPSSRRLRLPTHQTRGRIELPQGATSKGGSRRRRRLRCMRPTIGRLRSQPSRPAPSLPHQVPNETQTTQAPQCVGPPWRPS
jgi:hypothetical protein